MLVHSPKYCIPPSVIQSVTVDELPRLRGRAAVSASSAVSKDPAFLTLFQGEPSSFITVLILACAMLDPEPFALIACRCLEIGSRPDKRIPELSFFQ
jgi:hypothetical protein